MSCCCRAVDVKEVERHVPVMVAAARRIQAEQPIRLCMILPNEQLAGLARKLIGDQIDIQIRIGGQAEILPEADLAITKSGSVTMECALFGVPAVVIYITSWLAYQIGRRNRERPFPGDAEPDRGGDGLSGADSG